MAISCKRPDKENAVVLLVDQPTDFLSPVRDIGPEQFKNHVSGEHRSMSSV